jgi:flagellar basal body-associated protein FliL
MKNKKNIYILLPIVLLIWGAVLYQFFTFTSGEQEQVPNTEVAIKPFKIKDKDTFSISISKRDPFLGSISSSENSTKVKKTITTHKAPKLKEEMQWPEVSYNGIVSDNKEKVKVYMLIINGKTYLMRKGEQQEGVKLKDGDRETIYALYKGDLKVIFIQ